MRKERRCDVCNIQEMN